MKDMIIIKCIVIGESGIGKSSISDFYVNDRRATGKHCPTIGIEFFAKKLEYEGRNLNLHIWDTAGQERFKSIVRNYYRDAYGALICFSITEKETFESLSNFIEDLKTLSHEHIKTILVGTFSDLEHKREVSREDAEKLADELGIEYFEVSAKTGKNVDKCFETLVKKIHDGIESKQFNFEIYDTNIILDDDSPNMFPCCGYF